MRAGPDPRRDAGRRRRGPGDASRTRPWWPAPAPRWPMPRCACSAVPTAGVSSSWRARGATAPTAAWPPRSWPGGAPGCACWRRTTPQPGPGSTLPPCDLVVDGAYGTGFRGSYDAPGVPTGARVLAIDIPSGVDADTGEAPGEAVRADRTVTFAALKPGLLQGAGAVCSGAVEVADIGIGFPTPQALLVEDADVAARPAATAPGQQVDDRGRRGRRLGRHGGRRHPVHPRRHGRRRGHDPARLAGRPDGGLAHRGRAHAPARGGLGRCVPGGHGQVQGGRDRPRARHRRGHGGGDPGRHRRRAGPAGDRRRRARPPWATWPRRAPCSTSGAARAS